MVNSLKDPGARRNHKERAQPLHRQRLGLLEKHKDYVHRARDYKSKQDRIRKLREKAAFRNKDEFYWGMVKGKTKNGLAMGDRGNVALTADVVQLLKTQDVGYLRVQIAKDEKVVARLRMQLESTAAAADMSEEWSAAAELAEVEKLAEMGVVINPDRPATKSKKGKGRAPPEGHVYFADGEPIPSTSASPSRTAPTQVDEEEEQPVDLGWADPTPSASVRKPASTPSSTATAASGETHDARERRLDLLTDLSAHLARLRLLRQAEAKLQDTKRLMGKGAARVQRKEEWVEDENQPEDRNGERKRFEGKVWKWKLERKR